MARLLFVFCLFLAIGLIGILRAPDFDFLSSEWDRLAKEDRSLDAASEEDSAESSAAASSPTPRAASRATSVSAPAPSVSVPGTFPSESSPEPPSPKANLITQPSPVYAVNSAHGNVVKLLEDGDEFELGLEVLGPEGWWVEVKLDPQTSGFMPSANVRRNP